MEGCNIDVQVARRNLHHNIVNMLAFRSHRRDSVRNFFEIPKLVKYTYIAGL